MEDYWIREQKKWEGIQNDPKTKEKDDGKDKRDDDDDDWDMPTIDKSSFIYDRKEAFISNGLMDNTMVNDDFLGD